MCNTSGGFVSLLSSNSSCSHYLLLYVTFYAVQMQPLLSVVTDAGRYVTLGPPTVPPTSLALPYSRTRTDLVRDTAFLALVSQRARYCTSFSRCVTYLEILVISCSKHDIGTGCTVILPFSRYFEFVNT